MGVVTRCGCGCVYIVGICEDQPGRICRRGCGSEEVSLREL